MNKSRRNLALVSQNYCHHTTLCCLSSFLKEQAGCGVLCVASVIRVVRFAGTSHSLFPSAAAFLLLRSSQLLWLSVGVLLMGVAHAVITIKGTHLASHGALSESQAWGKFWAIFFIEVLKDKLLMKM